MTSRVTRVRLRSRAISILLLALAPAIGANAGQLETVRDFHIDATSLDVALLEFSRQAAIQVMVPSNVVAGLTSSAVNGRFAGNAALARLLDETGLGFRAVSDDTVTVIRTPIESKAPAAALKTRKAGFPPEKTSAPEKGSWPEPMDEMTVSATRRPEDVQDIPLSVAVFNANDLKRRTLERMDDYLLSTVGVTIVDHGPGFNTIIIRGVSGNATNESIVSGSTIGMYFGGIPVARSDTLGNPDLKLVDIERVEVLRGPQGVTYGSGSMGGVLQTFPVDADLEKVEGSVGAEYSLIDGFNGNGNKRLQGVANIPLVKGSLGVRAVAYRLENDGYVRNVAGSDADLIAAAANYGGERFAVDFDDVGANDDTGGRLSVLWEPSDDFRARYTYIRQDSRQFGLTLGGLVDLDRGRFSQSRLYGGRETQGNQIEIHNATVEYDFAWASLMSSSSWMQEMDWWYSGDFGALPVWGTSEYAPDAFAQEIRLVSQLTGRHQFTLGAYYEDVDVTRRVQLDWEGDPALNVFDSDSDLGDLRLVSSSEQGALFGEYSYSLTEQLAVSVGGRFFRHTRVDDDTRQGAIFGRGVQSHMATEADGDTYKVAFSYAPAEDALLYASWSQGFRLGRGLTPLPQDLCDVDGDGFHDGTNIPADLRALKSDSLDSYEIGGKFSLLDNRWVINAAVYRVGWKGLPLSVLLPTCNFVAYVNASSARTRGFEVESALRITEDLRVNVGASFTNAELSQDVLSLDAVAGSRLPGSPQLKANIGVEYRRSLLGRDSYLRGDYAYVGGLYSDVNESSLKAGDYHHVNMRVGTAVGQTDISLFVRNVFDDDGFTYAQTRHQVTPLRPRTIGVSLGFAF